MTNTISKTLVLQFQTTTWKLFKYQDKWTINRQWNIVNTASCMSLVYVLHVLVLSHGWTNTPMEWAMKFFSLFINFWENQRCRNCPVKSGRSALILSWPLILLSIRIIVCYNLVEWHCVFFISEKEGLGQRGWILALMN